MTTTNKQYVVMIAGLAQAGMEAYVKNYLTELMQRSRTEDGCLIYNIHQSTTNKGEFMVYMVWKDEATFQRHNSTPKMQEFRKKLAPEMFDQQSPKTYWQLLEG